MTLASYVGLRAESEHPKTWGDGFGVLLDDRIVCLLLDGIAALRAAPCERALARFPKCGSDAEADGQLGVCGRCAVLAQFDNDGWGGSAVSPSDELIDAARSARTALYKLEDALDAQWRTRHPLSDGEFSELRRLSIRLEDDTVRKIERACQEYEQANQPEHA